MCVYVYRSKHVRSLQLMAKIKDTQLFLLPTRRWVHVSFTSSPLYTPPCFLHSSETCFLAASSSPVTVRVHPVRGGQR